MKMLTPLALMLLAGTLLQADDGRFGLQATVAQPSGDVGDSNWMDSKLGYGVGLHGLIGIGTRGVAIVPRLDYTRFQHDRRTSAVIHQDDQVDIFSGGADFNFYLGGTAGQGFYFLAGAGYASGKFDSSYAAGNLILRTSATKGAPYLQAGAGIMFNGNVGVEARYQSLQFKGVETTVLGYSSEEDVSCPSIQASLILRF